MRKKVENVNQSGDADEVFELMHGLMHLDRAQRARALADAGLGVSPLEAKALGFFGRNPDATLSDLVAHSGRDKSQLAKLIAGLRERGFLEAREDENDRRNLRLRCTPQADEIHRAVRQHSRRFARAALAELSNEESAQLARLLRKLNRGARPPS